MKKATHSIYTHNNRVSTILKISEGADCAENFCIEMIEANDTVEVWLYFDAQNGFVYPKELMLKMPHGFDMGQIEDLLTVNLDAWKRTYGDKYLKPEWNF